MVRSSRDRFDTCDGFYISDLKDYEKTFLKQNITALMNSEFTCMDEKLGEQLACVKIIKNVPLNQINKKSIDHYSTESIRKTENVDTLNQLKLIWQDEETEYDTNIGDYVIDPTPAYPRLSRVIMKEGDEHILLYEPLDGPRQIKLAQELGLHSILAEVDECILHTAKPEIKPEIKPKIEPKIEPIKSDISLEDIPKSHALVSTMGELIAATTNSGLEHGMVFCKKDDKLIVDETCIGTECKIKILPKQCGHYEHDFHTHPGHHLSNFSVPDIYVSAYRTYWGGKSNIGCVGGSKTNTVKCAKIIHPISNSDMSKAKDILSKFNKYDTYAAQEIAKKELAEVLNSEIIEFER